MERRDFVQIITACWIMGFGELASASIDIIGPDAREAKEKDHPAFCHFEIENGGDGPNHCSGTLVSDTVIATAAHCFKKDFSLSYASVNVECGGRRASVLTVELPDDDDWVDQNKPSAAKDFAKVTLTKPLSGSMPFAKGPSRFFDEAGLLRTGAQCMIAGFGNDGRSNIGRLHVAEVTRQKIQLGHGIIVLSHPKRQKLLTSVDEGDSGGALLCRPPISVDGTPVTPGVLLPYELIGVTVSYSYEKKRGRTRLENTFATIWTQSL